MSAVIHSERLELAPMTPMFLRASLEGELREAERVLNVRLPASWPDIRAILQMRLAQLEAEPGLQPWLLRAVILRGPRDMIGHVGFHTAPGADYLRDWCPSGVELGCSVFAAHRRRGYAHEAAVALMQWASATHGVTEFLATAGVTNLASQAMVARLGFEKVGSHVDEVDGVEGIYIRRCAETA